MMKENSWLTFWFSDISLLTRLPGLPPAFRQVLVNEFCQRLISKIRHYYIFRNTTFSTEPKARAPIKAIEDSVKSNASYDYRVTTTNFLYDQQPCIFNSTYNWTLSHLLTEIFCFHSVCYIKTIVKFAFMDTAVTVTRSTIRFILVFSGSHFIFSHKHVDMYTKEIVNVYR